MIRTHVALTDVPIELHPVEQPSEFGPYVKPKGFWYEVNGDWRRWAYGEDFGIGRHLHCVCLGDESMLEIRSVEALDAFHRQYSPGRYSQRRDYAPDWQAVAKDYDGIEIAPYLWQRRLDGDVSWYYTWDCASGVIWRPRGATVTYRKLLRERKARVYA